MSRVPSAADQSLIDELAARGITVTARQLERWRGAGIIETTRWSGQGRGGSQSAYPDGTADQVIELVELLDETRSLDVALLTLFGRGRSIQHEGLVAAYTRSYEGLSQYGSEAGGDSWDRAEAVTRKRKFTSHPVVRAWRKNIRDRPNRDESVHFETRITGASVLHVLQTGEPTEDEDAALIAQASGIQEISESEELTIGFADTLAELSFPALAEVVESSTLDDLVQARDSLRRISGFLSQVSDVFPEPDDLLIALVAPALIQIMRLTGPWWEELLADRNIENTER